ncbi:PCYCGC domain-containing protein [Peribacillus asahii]|nr:PCYCGC domain-containing protein [Peribacillus asahii]USK86928.1 PCYCGC domain-containing protein [Peribacillus asahii]
MMRWKKTMLTFGICSTLLLGACSSKEESHDNHPIHTEHTDSGDIREETSGVEQMPEFLADKSEDMQTIYVAAAKHQKLLEQIPCYCGCGESANHKNNYDCFVFENKESGAVVWDDHGTKCGVCLEIAAQAVVDFNNGKTVKEIREAIDQQYEEGYAKPTDTPEV